MSDAIDFKQAVNRTFRNLLRFCCPVSTIIMDPECRASPFFWDRSRVKSAESGYRPEVKTLLNEGSVDLTHCELFGSELCSCISLTIASS